MAYGSTTITTATTLVVEANTRRQMLILVNNSSNICYYGPDASVTSSNGIPLYEYSTNENTKSIGGKYLGPIYATAVSSSNAEIRYWEVE